MKKYIFKIIVLAFSIALPFMIYFMYVHSMPSYGDNSIAGTIRYKIDLIKETEGERIILVGGSSSPYGTICDEFERAFDRPCINIGATAYLGWELYINILDSYARPGDVVVLAPEHILLKDDAVGHITVLTGIGESKDAWKHVPLRYYPGLFTAHFQYTKFRIEYSDRSPNGAIHSHFGPKGDVVIERESVLPEGYNDDDMISLKPELIYKRNLKLINKFSHKAAEKGITVLFAFAPVDELAIESTDEQNKAFENAVTEYIDIPCILDLDTSIMPGEFFYDSNNHLTSAGSEIYTAEMIKGLRPFIS